MQCRQHRVPSPAKVNFGLRILHRRADGFHAIQTICQMLDLYDWLTFRVNDAGTISLKCDTPILPIDDDNLVVRAAKLLQQTRRVRQGIEITLEKHIPIAAGLGGGSSNAATVLLVLNRLWNLHSPTTVLQDLAAQLGSDVPFFLQGPTAIAEGRGEMLSVVSPPPAWIGILMNPGFGVSAGWAYEQFNGRSAATDRTLCMLLRAIREQDLTLLSAALVNDLEAGVIAAYPVVREMQDHLRALGAHVIFMSGSGPTVGGLFGSPVIVQEALSALRRHSRWTALPFSTLSESPLANYRVDMHP